MAESPERLAEAGVGVAEAHGGLAAAPAELVCQRRHQGHHEPAGSRARLQEGQAEVRQRGGTGGDSHDVIEIDIVFSIYFIFPQKDSRLRSEIVSFMSALEANVAFLLITLLHACSDETSQVD